MINKNIIYENKFKNIINDINNIFNNANEDIKKQIYKDKGIKSRNSKINFKDALLYSFNYCKLNETKLKIVSDFNFKNNLNNNANNIFITPIYKKMGHFNHLFFSKKLFALKNK